MRSSVPAGSRPRWWHKLSWFVFLWLSAVLVTSLIAGIFKLLIWEATRH